MGESKQTEDFLRLYLANEARIFGYILTLLPQWNDAEEVFQETTLVLWQNFEQFLPGSDFFRWARQICLYRVMSYRKRQNRQPLLFSDEFLEQVTRVSSQHEDQLKMELQALGACIDRLSAADRELIASRYGSQETTKAFAARVGKPVNTVYKALERIRHALVECIRRRNAREERS